MSNISTDIGHRAARPMSSHSGEMCRAQASDEISKQISQHRPWYMIDPDVRRYAMPHDFIFCAWDHLEFYTTADPHMTHPHLQYLGMRTLCMLATYTPLSAAAMHMVPCSCLWLLRTHRCCHRAYLGVYGTALQPFW